MDIIMVWGERMWSFLLSIFDFFDGASDIKDILGEKKRFVYKVLGVLGIIIMTGIAIYFNYKWF